MISKPTKDSYCALEAAEFSVDVQYNNEEPRDQFTGFMVSITLANHLDGLLDLDHKDTVRLVDSLIRALSGDHPFTVDEG